MLVDNIAQLQRVGLRRDLDDFVALEHADAPKRGGKVLFAFDERQ